MGCKKQFIGKNITLKTFPQKIKIDHGKFYKIWCDVNVQKYLSL